MASYKQQHGERGSALVIIIAVAAVLVTAGAIAFVLLSKNKDGGVDLGKIGQKVVTANTSEGVKALLTSAKAGDYDAKCTYTDEAGNGTIYVSGATKVRVDTTINKKPGHLVRLGDSAYLWADGQKEGSKLPMTDSTKDSKYSPDTFASKVDQYHVTCQSVGHLDASLFTLPKDVNFVDLNSQTHSYSSSPEQSSN